VEEAAAPVVTEAAAAPEEPPYAEAAEPVVAVEEAVTPVEVAPPPEEQPQAEAVVAQIAEAVVAVQETAVPEPEEEPKLEATVAAAEETVAGLPEAAPEVAQAVVTPALEQAAPVATVTKEICAEETVLVPGTAIGSAQLSDVECYKQHLERYPKDDAVRLALARAHHKQEQIKLALEQYGLLLHAKSEILPEVISDMEMLVASRPDYMEAHELLADLYMRAGRLQEAVDRYRWILKRAGQTSA
jgi:tetratricopeptide (TPR) repeat protein